MRQSNLTHIITNSIQEDPEVSLWDIVQRIYNAGRWDVITSLMDTGKYTALQLVDLLDITEDDANEMFATTNEDVT